MTPMIEIILYLSATFALGLAMGFVMWNAKLSPSAQADAKDVDFWKKRFDQSRLEHGLDQEKIATLEEDKAALQTRLGKKR